MKQQFIFDDGYDEEKLLQTIAVSKRAFLEGEQERPVSRLEFLYQQSRYVKKRWWLLQGLLLAAVCLLLCQAETDYGIRRCLGLAGPLLAVLVLPELWKNRSCDALEVECTTLYTLRSIYSARLVLFAAVAVLCRGLGAHPGDGVGDADPVSAALQRHQHDLPGHAL